MRILVIGSGGREHALCWALAQSPRCEALFCAPGNAGISAVARCLPEVPVNDQAGIERACRTHAIDFVVVGPEAPLVEGLVDRLEQRGIRCFGPSRDAAILEGSKGFTKDLCARHGIPTAGYLRATDAEAAKAEIQRRGAPIVVKADGIAAGKGVVVARTQAEAIEAVDAIMLDRRFGTAGLEIVIEDFLEGEEVSFFAICDGKTALPLASAQDHKAVGDGDTGPNTGGMGAYSPAPALTPALEAEVMARIIRPTLAGMAAEGRPFKGVLFAGLMLTASGPQLIEYNVRFGDPECEVLIRRLDSDLVDLLAAAQDGRLDRVRLAWRPEAALGVVLAAEGYPGDYRRGTRIAGLDRAGEEPRVTIFHAGTKSVSDSEDDAADHILADGGRVLVVTALGETVGAAQAAAYRAVDRIDWPEGFCRRDIGWRAVAREKQA